MPLVALGLAVDSDGDRIYWTDGLASAIVSASADGRDRRTLFNADDDVDFPVGIALDPVRREVYWADVARATIVRAPLDDGTPVPIVEPQDGSIEPRAVAVDSVGGWVYWVDAMRNAIGRVQPDGTGIGWLEIARPDVRGFVASAPVSPDCPQATRRAARSFQQQAVKRASVCLEKVDAVKAVKRRADDARRAVATCIGQLSEVHPDGSLALGTTLAAVRSRQCGADGPPAAEIAAGCSATDVMCSSVDCALAACRVRAWQIVGRQHHRAAEWIEEVLPFVAAVADPRQRLGESAAARAVAVLDEIHAALRPHDPDKVGIPTRLPATGMTVSYRAVRAGGSEFVAVADDGDRRAGMPQRFVDNRDGTLSDMATGLMWEKKCDGCGGLHDVGSRLAWDPGHEGDGVAHWIGELNREDGTGFAGHTDWRVPRVDELQGLVDYGRFNPAVAREFDGTACGLGCRDLADPACSCTAMDAYWSATRLAYLPQNAFVVTFDLGQVSEAEGSSRRPVRAVRYIDSRRVAGRAGMPD
jgi:hypothetical protein